MTVKHTLKMELGDSGYNIYLGSDLLSSSDKFFDLDCRAAIVTDSGVPKAYSEAVAARCREAKIITVPYGEENKNIDTYSYICKELLAFGLQRKDAVVAVGGGVVGDMAGFAAATYMRGVRFYNVPTTLLSQVDSSIGGKCAIDFLGVKNILGAFYQPKAVLIDTDVLSTLDARQLSAGLAEVVKMSLTSDKDLFLDLENELWKKDLTNVIYRALMIKKNVVEQDERESSLRKILNFGHTLGHGIEALGGYLHGECVALGMLPMCSSEVARKLIPILKDMKLPTDLSDIDPDAVIEYAKHDKKGNGDFCDAVFVDTPGSYRLESASFSELYERLKNSMNSEAI
ncbi:MAG: 3-dehydroquinate synthase [Clostridia bacterium]|nr:3-dehydroquinate synthase [Clostridia bacterium]